MIIVLVACRYKTINRLKTDKNKKTKNIKLKNNQAIDTIICYMMAFKTKKI